MNLFLKEVILALQEREMKYLILELHKNVNNSSSPDEHVIIQLKKINLIRTMRSFILSICLRVTYMQNVYGLSWWDMTPSEVRERINQVLWA